MFIVGPAHWLAMSLAMIEGLVAYAYYDHMRCDPLASNKITDPNQVLNSGTKYRTGHP